MFIDRGAVCLISKKSPRLTCNHTTDHTNMVAPPAAKEAYIHPVDLGYGKIIPI